MNEQTPEEINEQTGSARMLGGVLIFLFLCGIPFTVWLLTQVTGKTIVELLRMIGG